MFLLAFGGDVPLFGVPLIGVSFLAISTNPFVLLFPLGLHASFIGRLLAFVFGSS